MRMAILMCCCFAKTSQFVHAIDRLLDLLIALRDPGGRRRQPRFRTLLFQIHDTRAAPGHRLLPTPTQDDRLQAGGAEFLGNHRKFRDFIVKATRFRKGIPKNATGHLRNLSRVYFPAAASWRLAAHRADAVLTQSRQAAQIDGETINRLARNLGSSVPFQRANIRRSRYEGQACLPYNSVVHPAVQKVAHKRLIKEITRETLFDFADLVQLRQLPGVQRPFEAIQIVLQLIELARADDGNGVAAGAQTS